MINHVDLMVALTADYLNVFVVRPNEDSADTIKLRGYVTAGITDKPQGFCYSQLLGTYARDRVYPADKDNFLKTLSPAALLEAFSGGRNLFEYDYRILEEDKIHNYTARYNRISKPEEPLSLVVGFRNIDNVVSAGHAYRNRGLESAYNTLSYLFYSLHRVNVQTNTYSSIKESPSIKKIILPDSNNFDENSRRIVSVLSSQWSREEALRFVDRSTLEERMKGKNQISMEFLSYDAEFCKLHFFKEDENEEGRLCHVIFGVEMLNEEKSQAIINVLSADYQNLFWIDLEQGSARILKMKSFLGEGLDAGPNKMFFYSKNLKNYLESYVYPDDRELLERAVSLEHLEEVFKTEEEISGNYRVVEEGKVHYCHYAFYKMANLNCVVAGIKNIDDIIERHEVEEQQREEQLAIFDTLAHNFKNVYIVNLEKASARVLKLDDDYVDHRLDNVMNAEFPYEPFLNEWIGEAVHPEDKLMLKNQLCVEHLREVFRTQEELTGNYRMLVGEKTIFYRFSINLMQDKVHVIAGFENVDRIIKEHLLLEKRERELKEAHLREEKEHAEVISAVSTIYSTIFRIDIDSHYYEVLNSTSIMESMAGKGGTFDDVKDMIFNYFVAPEMRAQMQTFAEVDTLADRLETVNTIATEYKNPRGKWFEARFIVKRRDEAGRAKEALYVARDITGEKLREFEQQEQLSKALEAAQTANKAKSTFLNSMSHDIRTPMNAIIGFTSLAQSHMDNKALVQDYLEKISTSSGHLLNLINDILDMSRIESGTVMLEEKPVNLLELLNDLKTMTLGLFSSKKQKFVIDMQDVIHENVLADKLRLNQILINIVGNAIKYTPEGGEVRLKLLEKPCSKKNYVTCIFSAKDNGIGMSEAFLEHIFESFSREHSATVTGIQGTGLGMAITKNLVDMMGGSITAQSEEGKGSLFTVTLDLQLSEEVLKAPAKPLIEDFSGTRALLVEDNALNLEIACAILESLGLKVDTATDGVEAVDIMYKAGEDDYDLIFMDIQMPKMDGYTATHEIRTLANNRKANIPIVAMTANAFEEDRKKSLEAGMNGHIAKPISIEEIIKVLEDIL